MPVFPLPQPLPREEGGEHREPLRNFHIKPYGPDAWLLHIAEQPGAGAFLVRQSLWRQINDNPPPGLAECVPGTTTMLFEFHSGQGDEAALKAWLKRHPADTTETPEGRLFDIPVRYNGSDLERVAEHAGLSVAEVIERHSAPEYRVDLIGFAPGFPYLDGLDARLSTPRLAKPRLRVAAGSVAIGGTHTGIYSLDGPGGWNVIGHTEVVLFDPANARCLLAPGDRLRFIRR